MKKLLVWGAVALVPFTLAGCGEPLPVEEEKVPEVVGEIPTGEEVSGVEFFSEGIENVPEVVEEVIEVEVLPSGENVEISEGSNGMGEAAPEAGELEVLSPGVPEVEMVVE
ncbi:MAG: hypothetical protein LBD75_00195 [Candidatus Peribacteria bacterium]|nr:hypothetical protein [Candidatus Peribacteria bacterium]